MKKLNFSLLSLISLLSLSSCSLVSKKIVRDLDSCYIGAVGIIETSENYTVTNFLHIDLFKEENKLDSQAINLQSYSGLVNLGANSYDGEGNLILYFNLANYLNQRTGNSTITELVNEGYVINVYFSLGNSDDLVSTSTSIKEDGIYAFSTLKNNGESLDFNHIYVEKEIIEWNL